MSKYNNGSVLKAKNLLVSRLSYIIQCKLEYTSQRVLADRVGMSANIISKVKRQIHKGVSFDALLELARRLDVSLKLYIEVNGLKDDSVAIELGAVPVVQKENGFNVWTHETVYQPTSRTKH
ncbi:lambda repressor-like DNA-binding protein [Serratia phage vB_SmaM-Sureiya]|nr:lambda repressor-like DNA-binding protein [Serratia phage vB_SmaM-Sureiya]